MMNIEELREYCLSKTGATEDFPFGEDTLVFKVMGKMFALTGLNDEDQGVNLKAHPEQVIEWRESYPEDVLPGYHMNKTHWNTVRYNGGLPAATVCDMIDVSYNLIVQGLTKAQKKALEDL